MPQPSKGPRLGGGPAHERLMLANLATALFEHGRITTTETKAKRLRPYAEKLVSFGKRGDLHARRQVAKVIRDKGVLHVLFAEIGPRYANRPGGYTRITKIGPRKGDNAPMAVIELVEGLTVGQEAVGEAERARGTRFAGPAAAAGAAGQAESAIDPGAAAAAQAAAGNQVAVPTEGGDTEVVTGGTTASQAEDAAGDLTQDLTGGELSGDQQAGAERDGGEAAAERVAGEAPMTGGADDSPAGGGTQAAQAGDTSQAEGDRA